MVTIDWVIVAVYMLVVAGMGIWFSRRQKDMEEYFIGGRHVPWWAIGLSFLGSTISTATFIAFPGQGYGGDWRPHLLNLMLPLVGILTVTVIIPYYRTKVKMSGYEFLERRFGYGVRCYTSVFYLIYTLFRSGFILFLMAKAISTMTGWSSDMILLAGGLIAVGYTYLGGLEAVIWTDVLQSVTLFAGGLVSLIIILFSGQGESAELFSIAYNAGKFHMMDWSWNLKDMTVWVTVLYGLSIYAGGDITAQDKVQRYLAAKSDAAAKRAVWLGVIASLVTWTMFLLIGTLLYSYYQMYAEQLPADIAADETRVFPHFIATKIPKGVVGLILAGMCAAAMSSLDTGINSMAMVSVRDLYLHFRPGASDKVQLWLGKVATGFWGGMGVIIGLILNRGVEQALQFSLTVFSIIGGGILGMFLLGMLVRRAHAWGIYIGLACGVLISGWGILDLVLDKVNVVLGGKIPSDFIEAVRFPYHRWLVFFFSNLASFGIGWLASVIIPKPSDPGNAV